MQSKERERDRKREREKRKNERERDREFVFNLSSTVTCALTVENMKRINIALHVDNTQLTQAILTFCSNEVGVR